MSVVEYVIPACSYHFVIAVWSAKTHNPPVVKPWEIIADRLSKAGWSWGCVSTINSNGHTSFGADAHRGDGKRFVVHSDEKLSAFVELGRQVLTVMFYLESIKAETRSSN